MMRTLFVTALLTIGLTGVAGIVNNGDFGRTMGNGSPEGWKLKTKSVEMAVDRTNVPADVKQSLKVVPRAESEKQGAISQKITGFKQGKWTLSGYLKSSEPETAMIQVKLFRKGKELERISVGWSGTDWEKHERSFKTKKADRLEVLLRFRQNKDVVGKPAWFADVRLEPATDKGDQQDVSARPREGSFQIVGFKAVPTYHNAGLYIDYQGEFPDGLETQVRYRELGSKQWLTGMPMVSHDLDQQLRSSILGLTPGRKYGVEVSMKDESTVYQTVSMTVETWRENPPIGKVKELPAHSGALVISEAGSPDGYILYRPAKGQVAVIDGGQNPGGAVFIKKAAYVILENLVIKGGAKHGVQVLKSHHIHVRRCDISGWGNPGIKTLGTKRALYLDKNGKIINNQAGVYLGEGVSQAVVEDNFIHTPRGTASSWKYGHAAGPEPVHQLMTEGNNVIRNNDLIGAEEHWWNDGFAGSYNREIKGGMHRDGDGYGNIIGFCNDDGAELDGGQINIRFYNNWIDKALCGISGAPNRRGPSYVFNNLLILGEEREIGGSVFKMGGSKYPEPGVEFLINNTGVHFNRGVSTHYGNGPVPLVTRNNVFAQPSRFSQAIAYKFDDQMGDFDYDLMQADGVKFPISGREQHAVFATPKFVDAAAGDFRLTADSPGIGRALPFVGINSKTGNDKPDMGALPHTRTTASFPDRPLDMSILPMHLRVRQTRGERPVVGVFKVRVPESAGTTWRAIPNSPWFSCEPSSGKTGSQVTTVTVKLKKTDLALRRWRGAVTIRTDRGYNRSAMVFFKVLPKMSFITQLEAEDGKISGGFKSKAVPDASGEACVVAPDEVADGLVELRFSVPEDGVYYGFVRGRIPGPRGSAGGRNGAYFRIDDGEWKHYSGNLHTFCWSWDSLIDKPETKMINGGTHVLEGQALVELLTKELVKLSLKKGEHTLTLKVKEPGLMIDKIAISNMPYPEDVE